MSKFIVFALVLVAACLILVNAAPAPEQILDAQTAINKIIGKLQQQLLQANQTVFSLLLSIPHSAAYNRIPGRSIVHPWEVATLIDPNTFVAHY